MTDRGADQPDDLPTPPRPRVIDRKLLDEIFGDVLPDTTNDERDPGSAGGPDRSGSYSEQWYRENRPPHHG